MDVDAWIAALPGLRGLFEQLERWRGDRGHLVGEELTLADLHLYPMLSYFVETPEGVRMLDSLPNLQQWLRSMGLRDSVRATAFHEKAEDETEYY